MYRNFLGLEVLPERPQLPVVVGACFELSDDMQSASLRLQGNNAEAVTLTIVHETRLDITGFSLAGNAVAETFLIRDGEALIILGRIDGTIVACGLYQANLGAHESIGSVLIPVATSNLEVMQSDASMVARVFLKALDDMECEEDTQKLAVVR